MPTKTNFQQAGVSTDQESLSREHRHFYERFQTFWAAPTGPRVSELIAPHAKIHFTGVGTMSGSSYVDWMANQLKMLPDLVVTLVDYAGSGNLIYIFWNAAATINGAYRTYYGVDRFRIENGLAVEEHVIFDSATLQGPPAVSNELENVGNKTALRRCDSCGALPAADGPG